MSQPAATPVLPTPPRAAGSDLRSSAATTTGSEHPTRTSWIDTYQVLSIGVLVWAVAVVVQHTWTADFLLHVGTVRALAGNLLTPPDPMVGTGSGSPYYSPFTLLAAVLVRLTGLSPTAVFGGIALANTAVVLWAFRRFCGWFTTSPFGTAIALLATFFLWGLRPPVWSGFLSLRSLAEVLPYPSTLAFGLMLLAWDRLLRYRENRNGRTLIAFGLLAAAITLVHSFTAVNTAIGAAAILVGFARSWRPRDLLRLVAAGAGAILLVLGWPYSSMWKLFTTAADFAAIHRMLWDNLIDPRELSCVFGLVALVPLLLRLRRDRTDPLVLMFGFAAAVVAFGVATAQYHLLRVLPMVMLPLHVAFGAFLADTAANRSLRRLVATAAVVVVGAGLAVDVAPMSGFVAAVPTRSLPAPLQAMTRTASLSGPSHQYDFIRNYVPEGSTILTDQRTADRHLNWLGYYTVNPGWPNPWIGDEADRATNRALVLDPITDPATRGAVANRYRARCVLITRTPAVTAATAVAGFRRVRTWKGGALFCR